MTDREYDTTAAERRAAAFVAGMELRGFPYAEAVQLASVHHGVPEERIREVHTQLYEGG